MAWHTWIAQANLYDTQEFRAEGSNFLSVLLGLLILADSEEQDLVEVNDEVVALQDSFNSHEVQAIIIRDHNKTATWGWPESELIYIHQKQYWLSTSHN